MKHDNCPGYRSILMRLGEIEGTRPQIMPIAGGPNPLTASIFSRAEYDFPNKSITPEAKVRFWFSKMANVGLD